MRNIFIGVGILLLLIAIGLGVFKFNRDNTAKQAIEKEGSEITQVAVYAAEVYVSPRTGEGHIHDLVVGNPQGFQTPYAFSFPDITLTMDLPSLTTQLFIVRELHIMAPDINIEQTNNNNNIQVIQAHVKAFVDANKTNIDARARRFIIESLTIETAKLHVSAPLIQAELVTIPLPDIDMVNIGKDQGGVTSAQLTQILMEQINLQIVQAIKSRGLENMIDISELAPPSLTIKDRIRNFFKPLIDAN
ncbi:MAG: hypothetical protein ABSF18_00465 [Gammaproteobacteria bacterium]